MLKINDDTIEHVQVSEYLGIRLDHDMSWNSYVSKLCSSLGYKINKLSRLRATAPHHVLNRIYISCIQPVIDYAICSWGFTYYKYNIDKIQRLQNFAARIVSGN